MNGLALHRAGTVDASRLPAGTPHAPRHIVNSMRKRDSRPHEQVFAVTGLPASLRDDQSERMHRYLVSMGIRTVSFILAVVALAVLHWTVVGWLFVVAAVVLPYIAVVVANATRSTGGTTLGPVTPVAPDNAAAPQISPRRPDEEPPP
jgi:Protein of unknown function (DUF3099)